MIYIYINIFSFLFPPSLSKVEEGGGGGECRKVGSRNSDGIAFGGSREGERLLLFDFYEGNVNVKINYSYYLFLLIFIITDIRRWKVELSRYDYQRKENCPRSGIPRVTRNDGLYTRSRRKRVKLISILALEIAFISVEEKKKERRRKKKKEECSLEVKEIAI